MVNCFDTDSRQRGEQREEADDAEGGRETETEFFRCKKKGSPAGSMLSETLIYC